MARSKKPPQSAEDVELAKETITAAFDDAVERHRARLAKALEEVLRLQREIVAAAVRRTARQERDEITEETALDAWTFAGGDMRELARRCTSPSVRLDHDVVQAARRKHEVTKRWLSDRGLLPAALVDPNWRPTR
jgi:vacuolar-type H+-ATPase subunit H